MLNIKDRDCDKFSCFVDMAKQRRTRGGLHEATRSEVNCRVEEKGYGKAKH